MSGTFSYLGTVSSGTGRTEDLLKAFLPVLAKLSDGTDGAVMAEASEWLKRDRRDFSTVNGLPYSPFFTDEESRQYRLCHDNRGYDIVCGVMDALDRYAPEGFYFGSNVGDGTDMGFWEAEED